MERSEEAARAVQKAKGRIECVMDGTSVNTTEGWREIRTVVISNHEAGQPADLRHWADHHLPDPQAKWCWAKIADHQAVGEQVRVTADRLELGRGRGVRSINDGAKWIWMQMSRQLPEHEGQSTSIILDDTHAHHVVCAELASRRSGHYHAGLHRQSNVNLIDEGPFSSLFTVWYLTDQ